MGRTIAGVVVGVVVAWLTVMLAEFASAPLHPMPAGFDMHDPASVAAFVATLPVSRHYCWCWRVGCWAR